MPEKLVLALLHVISSPEDIRGPAVLAADVVVGENRETVVAGFKVLPFDHELERHPPHWRIGARPSMFD